MGITIENFTKALTELSKEIRLKADLLYKDLIEPSDMYCKHYSASNNILVEQASEIWASMTQSSDVSPAVGP